MGDEAERRLQPGRAEERGDILAVLFDQHGPALYRVAWTMLRSRPDAEDAVQEVFLGLARSRQTLGRVENWRAYLFAALRHAVARVTARRKLEPLCTDLPARKAAAEIDVELFGMLERGLAALPAEQREVLSLKIDGGLTFAEIAEVLGIRLKTAASRYRYALEKLRATMDDPTP